MQHHQFTALAHDHQEELRRDARKGPVRSGLGLETRRRTARPLPLRLLDRVVGPH